MLPKLDTGSLTDRQLELFMLLTTTWLTGKEIANRMGISRRMVDNHQLRIFKHLGVHSRIELILRPSGGFHNAS